MMENIYNNIQYTVSRHFLKLVLKDKQILLHLRQIIWLHLASIVLNWMLMLGNQANFWAHAWPKMAVGLLSFRHCDLAFVSDLYFLEKAPRSVNRTMRIFYTKGLNFARLLMNEISRLMYCMMYLDTTDTLHVLVSILMPKPRQLTCLWNKKGFPKYSQLYKTAFCVDWCDFLAVDRNM